MRIALGFAMAVLSGIELAILSMPLAPLVFAGKGPKDEFSGIAMLGGAFMLGGAAMIVGFIAGFAIVLTHYRDEIAPRIKRVLVTRAITISTALIGIFVFAKSEAGLLWAIALSGIALTIGLPISLRRPYQPEARWGEGDWH